MSQSKVFDRSDLGALIFMRTEVLTTNQFDKLRNTSKGIEIAVQFLNIHTYRAVLPESVVGTG
ncbi:hypothetical protein QUB68_29260 [Microcoleus sp. A006_D1]|uniref:hypothetical protein n=1 Tax=Microcoleus sp. A006_D1 TaxID=3055267 RepID=UPI002FD17D0B